MSHHFLICSLFYFKINKSFNLIPQFDYFLYHEITFLNISRTSFDSSYTTFEKTCINRANFAILIRWISGPWYKALDPWIEINFIRDDGTRQLHNSRDMETAWGRKLVRLLGNAGGDTCRKPRLDNLLLRELHWSRIQPETAFLAVPRRIGHQGSLD